MSDPANKVEEAAEKAIEQVVQPAVQETPNIAPSGDTPAMAAVVAANQAVEAGLHAKEGTKPTYDPLPAYALHYAPLMWLHSEEQYWPGNPLEHLENCIPQHKSGALIDVPKDVFGKCSSLKLSAVNDPDVYLCLNEDPRVNARIEKLMATHGKPDPVSRRSDSACWMILVDKSKIVEPGVVDVFYFYFYPYNLGNTVAFTKFGNHVGDWEHSMVRFKDGKPIALHLSAHADGHSFPWSIVEKMGDRPVGYVARGSHAMYAKPGSKHYSPVPIVGPVDYADKGFLWDPSLNYVAAKFDVPTATFTPLTAPPPTATTTAAPPTPGEAPAPASHPGEGSATPATTPQYDTKLTPEEIILVLDYKGRWGNSFSDIREPKGSVGDKIGEVGEKLHSVLSFGKKHDDEAKQERRRSLGLSQKLSALRWAEGPTGPRYKSLERVGVTWNTTALLNDLV